jgi:hypothetical protein
MSQDSGGRYVPVFFLLGGLLAFALSVLVTRISYSSVGEGPLDFSSPAISLFANPGFLFASTMFLFGFIANKMQLLPNTIPYSKIRMLSGLVLAAATYPVWLFFGLIVSTLIPESFAYLPALGLIMSLIFVVGAAGLTVRVITGRWPPAFWKGLVAFCLGVPLLTATVGYLLLPSNSRSWVSSVGVKTVGDVPLLLLVAEILLALLVGHWLSKASRSIASEPG